MRLFTFDLRVILNGLNIFCDSNVHCMLNYRHVRSIYICHGFGFFQRLLLIFVELCTLPQPMMLLLSLLSYDVPQSRKILLQMLWMMALCRCHCHCRFHCCCACVFGIISMVDGTMYARLCMDCPVSHSSNQRCTSCAHQKLNGIFVLNTFEWCRFSEFRHKLRKSIDCKRCVALALFWKVAANESKQFAIVLDVRYYYSHVAK